MKKAQSSVEFAVMTSFMVFFVTVFLGISMQRLATIQRENHYALLQDLARYIKKEIELGSIAVDGYKRSFDIPSSLAGLVYEIEINPYSGTNINHSEMTIRYTNYDPPQELSVLLPKNITGSIDIDESPVVNLTKKRSTLYINQI